MEKGIVLIGSSGKGTSYPYPAKNVLVQSINAVNITNLEELRMENKIGTILVISDFSLFEEEAVKSHKIKLINRVRVNRKNHFNNLSRFHNKR